MIDPRYLHGNRKNDFQCGGLLESTGNQISYGWASVSEWKCLKCGKIMDSTDAEDEMLDIEIYKQRKIMGWKGYE